MRFHVFLQHPPQPFADLLVLRQISEVSEFVRVDLEIIKLHRLALWTEEMALHLVGASPRHRAHATPGWSRSETGSARAGRDCDVACSCVSRRSAPSKIVRTKSMRSSMRPRKSDQIFRAFLTQKRAPLVVSGHR